jgi:8-oxo-dGTP pyrophosphatase MutT (NUDIX family)
VSTAWTPELRDRVRGRLAEFTRRRSEGGLRRAAVAITLLRGGGGEAAFPVFLRHAALSRHAGQMGLPGGRLETGEGESEAARRELQEELGIEAGPDAVLGALDDFETRSGFAITPVVLWSEAPLSSLRPGSEIDRLYVLSLDQLAGAVAAAPDGRSSRFCLGFPWGSVYAPTAAMLYQFSEVALGGREARVLDFYQPPFTWR